MSVRIISFKISYSLPVKCKVMFSMVFNVVCNSVEGRGKYIKSLYYLDRIEIHCLIRQ